MKLTNSVDLPEEILDAQDSGDLVLFVGAGVSVDAPSNLPRFKGLAEQLGVLAGVPWQPGSGNQADYFLGTLPDDFEVHANAVRILSDNASLPNESHRSLVQIASAGGSPRLVTTNYDNHLARAAAAENIDLGDCFLSPAVPLGDDFAGLVHLHGSILGREPRGIVLTDRDAGRAYLADGWATDFLRRLFDRYTVVFVGFSHEDPLISYMGLGLPSKAKPRYVLTSEPRHERWDRLKITAIGYDSDGSDHSEVGLALAEWARLSRMSLVDHEARMRDVVAEGPVPKDPTLTDYVAHRLRSEQGVRQFCSHARSIDWLDWVCQSEAMKSVHHVEGQTDPASTHLGAWFAQQFVADHDSERHIAGVEAFRLLGANPSRSHVFQIGMAARELAKSDSVMANRWGVLIASCVARGKHDLEDSLISELAGDPHWPLLRHLLAPYLSLSASIRWYDDIRVLPQGDVGWLCGEYELREVLSKCREWESQDQQSLLVVLEEAIRRAHELQNSYGGADVFDAIAFRRSAIEPDEQDDFPEAIDVVIDTLRDLSEGLQAKTPGLWHRFVGSSHSTLQRIGIHLLTEAEDLDADRKIAWLLDNALLFGHHTKHEVFRLISAVLGGVSDQVRARLLSQVLEGSPHRKASEDNDLGSYEVFNLLAWLKQAAPDWLEVKIAIEEILERHDYEVRGRPDLDHYMSSGWEPEPPFLAADLLAIPTDSRRLAEVERILAESGDFGQGRGRPSQFEAMRQFSSVAQIDPAFGVRIWDSNLAEGVRTGVRRALIEGWADTDLGDEAEQITARLETVANREGYEYSVAHLLRSQARKAAATDDELWARLRALAGTLWNTRATTYEPTGSEPGMFVSLNHWPGMVTEFWLLDIASLRKQGGAGWTGIEGEQLIALMTLRDGPNDTWEAVGPALGADLQFLHSADHAFAREVIFPLFAPNDRGVAVWAGFLGHPRISAPLMQDGFGDCIHAGLDFVASTPSLEKHLRSYVALVALILVKGEIDSELKTQLLIGLAVHAQLREMLPDAIARLLRELDESVAAGIWDEWLAAHVASRVEGLPRIATPAELSGWADMLATMPSRAVDGLAVFKNELPGLRESLLARLHWTEEYVRAHPELVATVLARRLRVSEDTTGQLVYRCQRWVALIREVLGVEAAQPVVDAGIAIGWQTTWAE